MPVSFSDRSISHLRSSVCRSCLYLLKHRHFLFLPCELFFQNHNIYTKSHVAAHVLYHIPKLASQDIDAGM